jgi:hypothetical protein
MEGCGGMLAPYSKRRRYIELRRGRGGKKVALVIESEVKTIGTKNIDPSLKK